VFEHVTVTGTLSPSGAHVLERTCDAAVGRPVVSIIVPVHNAAEFLRTSMASLVDASVHDYELIVVDDASTDGGAEIASKTATRLIRVPTRVGPAKARNLGAVAARGDYLVFLDADVRVHPATVDRLVNVLIEQRHVGAVFGSYDDRPACRGLVSQFRNLLHHDIHQSSHEDAISFWAGCGAIKRESFLRIGGFDEGYRRPHIEDIELGYRLHAGGERIVLAKDAQVTHLKSWSLWSMIKCDFASRGIPWTRLLLQKRWMPNDLNLRYVHRVSVLCIGLSVCALIAAGSSAVWMWLAIALVAGILVASDSWTARGGHEGIFAASAATIAILAVVRTWDEGGTALAGLSLMAAAIAVNTPFYARLSRSRGRAFVLLAIPLQIVHYAVCGAAFAAGCGLHAWDLVRGTKRGPSRTRSPLVEAADSSSPRCSAVGPWEEQTR
jgi:GT2 family glycosyltransferase